jgi:DNA modification methylase
MVAVFEEVRRVLRPDGTCWVNMGDCYTAGGRGGGAQNSKQQTNVGSLDAAPNVRAPGLKPKDLVGMPWRLAFALQAAGWWLRMDVIWEKPNPMPESVTDRPTKAHEYIFLLTKAARYFYDQEAITEPISYNTHLRLSQDVANQIGSTRANAGGKTNGNMKAVVKKPTGWKNSDLYEDQDPRYPKQKAHGANSRMNIDRDPQHADRPVHKQDQVGKRQYTGFNERYFGKAMELDADGTHHGQNARRLQKGSFSNNKADRVKYNESFNESVCLATARRNKRSVWTVATAPYKEAHFATFPPKLIEPCILAGTSASGCCPDCGAPWTRQTEQGQVNRDWQKACGGDDKGEYHGQNTKDYDAAKAQPASTVKARILAGMTETITTGWQPTCKCPTHVPVPCTVLDPFGGSGTTAQVSLEHGRHAILIELSEAYIELITKRLANVTPGLPLPL